MVYFLFLNLAIDFYNVFLRIFTVFSKECSQKSCPTMSCGKE